MFTYTNKKHKKKGQRALAASSLGKRAKASVFQFQDNRPHITKEKKLQSSFNTFRADINQQSKYFVNTSHTKSPSQSSISSDVLQPLWTAVGFKHRIEQTYDIGRTRGQKFMDFFFKKQVYSDNPNFRTIIALLNTYHASPAVGNNARKTRMSLLHHMEQEAYNWYAQNKAVATLHGTTHSPYHNSLMAFINDVQAERRDVVQQTVHHGGQIWVPGINTMRPVEQHRIQALWTNLTTNAGRLRVSAASNNREKAAIHAHYLQLMSGRFGSNLLTKATTGNPAHHGHVITIDPRAGGEPAAAPHDHRASNRRLPHGDARRGQTLDPTRQVELTKRELRTTVTGPGSGSRIPFLNAPAMGAYYALGHDWNPVNDTGSKELMPSFVVLGHELGHAVRQQHGEGTVRLTSPYHNTPHGAAWHNYEEHNVITKTENRIRQEHNLGTRKLHRAVPL
ncbi:MAG: hypothetical protein EVB11_03100 [Winogradskyella sp.]|nr:MAG: hypothetical protein EVB11_03100 [Winogradskyella sp.]